MKRSRNPDQDNDTDGYGEGATIIPVPKILNLDTETVSTLEANAIQCSLPGHAKDMAFTNYPEYEKHYLQTHTNRCLECRRNFPTSHIMGLHIQEHHDALAEMQREQGASTYACFVETCRDSFKSYKERKGHLIINHTYPHNYFFAVTKFGIDRRQSMLVEHRRGKDNRPRKECRPEEQHAQSLAVNPASQNGNGGESKDVPMTDVERPAGGQPEAAEDVPTTETGQPAHGQSTRDLIVVEARKKSSNAETSERQAKQDSAAVDAEMEGLVGAVSSLTFVPRAIRLGPKQRARP